MKDLKLANYQINLFSIPSNCKLNQKLVNSVARLLIKLHKCSYKKFINKYCPRLLSGPALGLLYFIHI